MSSDIPQVNAESSVSKETVSTFEVSEILSQQKLPASLTPQMGKGGWSYKWILHENVRNAQNSLV